MAAVYQVQVQIEVLLHLLGAQKYAKATFAYAKDALTQRQAGPCNTFTLAVKMCVFSNGDCDLPVRRREGWRDGRSKRGDGDPEKPKS